MEESPIQVTTKDPKKVAAGKRLAEFNRKQREKLKELEKGKEKEKVETVTVKEENNATNYKIYCVNGILTIGGIIYYIYRRDKSDPKKTVDTPATPTKAITRPSKLELE